MLLKTKVDKDGDHWLVFADGREGGFVIGSDWHATSPETMNLNGPFRDGVLEAPWALADGSTVLGPEWQMDGPGDGTVCVFRRVETLEERLARLEATVARVRDLVIKWEDAGGARDAATVALFNALEGEQ